MENPHEAEQTRLLERIIKNVDKCNEAVLEMNNCVREILESSHAMVMSAQLFDNYTDSAANYMENLKMMPKPK